MWAVIGVGNPGPRYAATRHNLGHRVVDLLAQRHATVLRQASGAYESAEVERAETRALLVKPTTYVNRTGVAVADLVQRFGLAPEQLLVVVDDVHLPFARLRVRPSGGPGGHNGLRSIEEHLQSTAYARLRLGIGAPAPGEPLPDYVLGAFPDSERPHLDDFLARAADAVECILDDGVQTARARINARDPEMP